MAARGLKKNHNSGHKMGLLFSDTEQSSPASLSGRHTVPHGGLSPSRHRYPNFPTVTSFQQNLFLSPNNPLKTHTSFFFNYRLQRFKLGTRLRAVFCRITVLLCLRKRGKAGEAHQPRTVTHTLPEPLWKPPNQASSQRYPLTSRLISLVFLPFFRLGLACFRLLHLGPSAMISCFIDKCVWGSDGSSHGLDSLISA